MWRTESSRKDWESQKYYLIRSLFEDIPALSPIIETQEPTSLSDAADRLPSPLPDLIIEPIRKYDLYDEPAEFYTALEKEMRRMYRRDFLNVFDNESSSEELNLAEPMCKKITFEIPFIEEPTFKELIGKKNNSEISAVVRSSFEDTSFDIPAAKESTIERSTYEESEAGSRPNSGVSKSSDTISSTVSFIDKNENIANESHEAANATNSFQHILNKFIAKTKDRDEMSPTFTKQSQTTSDDSSVSGDTDIYEDLVIQAKGHREKKIDPYKMFKKNLESKICSWSKSSVANSDVSKIATSRDSSGNRNELPAESEDARIYSSDSSSSLNLPEPDLIRKRQTMTSVDSVPRRDSTDSECDSNRVSRGAELSQSMEKIISADMDIAVTAFTEQSFNTSSPNYPRKSITFKAHKLKKRVARSSPITKRRYVSNKALQTSFSDDEVELNNLWKNFFDGEPIVYKPCSCAFHICT